MFIKKYKNTEKKNSFVSLNLLLFYKLILGYLKVASSFNLIKLLDSMKTIYTTHRLQFIHVNVADQRPAHFLPTSVHTLINILINFHISVCRSAFRML